MLQDFMKTFNDFGKQAFESVRALGEINSELTGKLIAQQVDIANMCVEGGVRQMKAVSDSKDVKELLASQTELVQEYAEKFMDLAKTQASLAQTAGEKYQAWFEKGVQQANSTTKAAAKKVQAVANA